MCIEVSPLQLCLSSFYRFKSLWERESLFSPFISAGAFLLKCSFKILGSSSLPLLAFLYSFSISAALFLIVLFKLVTLSWKTGMSKRAEMASLAC